MSTPSGRGQQPGLLIAVAHRAQTLDRLDEVLYLRGGRLRPGPD